MTAPGTFSMIYRQVPAIGRCGLMLRVTTLYASSAVATAAYYTRYLADAPGEEPGRWLGRQADGLGLAGPGRGRRVAAPVGGSRPEPAGCRSAGR